MTKSTPSLNPASCQMSNTHGNKYFLSSFRCNIRGRKKKQSRNQALWTHEVIKRLSSHHFWLIIYVCCFYDLIRKSCGFESVYDNIVFFQLTRFTVKNLVPMILVSLPFNATTESFPQAPNTKSRSWARPKRAGPQAKPNQTLQQPLTASSFFLSD